MYFGNVCICFNFEYAFLSPVSNINNRNGGEFLVYSQMFGGYWPLAVPQAIISSQLVPQSPRSALGSAHYNLIQH